MPNKTIYIRREDEELWTKLPDKAEAVSKMLRGGDFSGVMVQEEVTRADLERLEGAETVVYKSPAMGPSVPPNMERACCLNVKPCQHWSFNGDNWVNSLSGRHKEVA